MSEQRRHRPRNRARLQLQLARPIAYLKAKNIRLEPYCASLVRCHRFARLRTPSITVHGGRVAHSHSAPSPVPSLPLVRRLCPQCLIPIFQNPSPKRSRRGPGGWVNVAALRALQLAGRRGPQNLRWKSVPAGSVCPNGAGKKEPRQRVWHHDLGNQTGFLARCRSFSCKSRFGREGPGAAPDQRGPVTQGLELGP